MKIRKLLIIISVVSISFIASFFYWDKQFISQNNDSVAVNLINTSISSSTTESNLSFSSKNRKLKISGYETNGAYNNSIREFEIYTIIHEMANTKIIAKDGQIWGETSITSNLIKQLINIINTSRWKDKKELLSILNRWKVNDFSRAVYDHNYVWNKLNGDTGEAVALKK